MSARLQPTSHWLVDRKWKEKGNPAELLVGWRAGNARDHSVNYVEKR